MKLSQKDIQDLIAYAKTFVGTPYKYGATQQEAPRVFDCSSFIQYIFAHYSIKLPRSSIEQAEKGVVIEDIKKILPGDIIFLRGNSGHYNKKFPQGIGHVVLYIGAEKVIHASSRRIKKQPIIEVGKVRIEKLSSIIKRGGPVTIIKRM